MLKDEQDRNVNSVPRRFFFLFWPVLLFSLLTLFLHSVVHFSHYWSSSALLSRIAVPAVSHSLTLSWLTVSAACFLSQCSLPFSLLSLLTEPRVRAELAVDSRGCGGHSQVVHAYWLTSHMLVHVYLICDLYYTSLNHMWNVICDITYKP